MIQKLQFSHDRFRKFQNGISVQLHPNFPLNADVVAESHIPVIPPPPVVLAPPTHLRPSFLGPSSLLPSTFGRPLSSPYLPPSSVLPSHPSPPPPPSSYSSSKQKVLKCLDLQQKVPK
ncbi:hypothetical protein LINPERHAP1_LOCUS31580 [Linum perenne]